MKREIRNAGRQTRLTTSSLPEWGLPCTSSPRCAHICARSLHSIAPALRSGRRPSRRENSDLTLIQLRVKSGLHEGGGIERFLFFFLFLLFDLIACQEKTVETLLPQRLALAPKIFYLTTLERRHCDGSMVSRSQSPQVTKTDLVKFSPTVNPSN